MRHVPVTANAWFLHTLRIASTATVVYSERGTHSPTALSTPMPWIDAA